MDFIEQILLYEIRKNINDVRMEKLAENISVQALKDIHNILSDNSLSDFECIEEIISVFEKIGSGGGNRHDFGWY